MLIARIKKETNIAEYIIYMWQIEDIIRSYKFDHQKIEKEIVEKFNQPEKVKHEISKWYKDLILDMKEEGIEKTGHLKSLKKIVNGINVLHHTLLTTIQDKKYQLFYDHAKASIDELVKRSKGNFQNEIEASLNALYGLLLLRLKGEKISAETTEAMESISKMLSHLAYQYNQMKMGKLNISEEKRN